MLRKKVHQYINARAFVLLGKKYVAPLALYRFDVFYTGLHPVLDMLPTLGLDRLCDFCGAKMVIVGLPQFYKKMRGI